MILETEQALQVASVGNSRWAACALGGLSFSETSMVQIPLYGRSGIVAYAMVDNEDAAWAKQYRWNHSDGGYAIRHDSKTGTVVRMHRELLGLKKGDKRECDHINWNRLDNRRSNIRAVTHLDNSRNLGLRATNRSGYRGVHLHKLTGKWRAVVKVNDKPIHIGLFATAAEAGEAARKARLDFGFPV